MNKKENSKSAVEFILETIFFGFLIGLLTILIYGFFQKDPGYEFFAPYWKTLYWLLGITIVLGTLNVIFKKDND